MTVGKQSAARASVWRVLIAPWGLVHRPSRAAACMVSGSRGAFWLSFGFGLLVLAGTVVVLAMWSETVEATRGEGGRILHERSFSEVWRDWHTGEAFGRAEAIGFYVSVLVFAAAAFAAWLLLPDVHQAGSVGRSYRRAFCVVASGVGLLAGITVGMGTAIVGLLNLQERAWGRTDEVEFSIFIACVACTLALVAWLGWAVTGVAGPGGEPDPSPRCEGCGYDLTHRPASGLCSECGLELDVSLTPGARRTGCLWENRRSAGNWLASSLELIVRPRKFYGRLKLRTDASASRLFAQGHYFLIGLCAAAWVRCMLIVEPGSGMETYMVPLMMLFLIPLVGWGLHRMIGSLAVSWCLARGQLDHARWARKVIAYEVVYLWVFCLYSAALISSFVLWDDWMTSGLGGLFGRWILGMPIEVAVVFLGNGVTGLLWFWRYRLAVRTVRWSNF